MHKQLIELMQQFTNDVDGELRKLKEDLTASARVAESFVDTLVNHAENGKARLTNVFETVADDMKVGCLSECTLEKY